MTDQIGLALSGGGAKGIAHVGALKVLEEARVPIHMLAGTSMGGIVGAAYAAGLSAAEIEDFFRSLRLLDIFRRDRTGLGLLGQDKIADHLQQALGGDLTFDQLKIPLALMAVDLERGEEVVIREGSVIEGVLATAAVPIIFPPVRWRNRLLVDGGLINPVPFNVVRHMGADRVIAVYTLNDFSSAPGDDARPIGQGVEAVVRLLLHHAPWAPLIDMAERSTSIMSRALVEQHLQKAPPDLMIKIMLKGVSLLDLDQVDKCIEIGERVARRRLPELIELRQAASSSGWIRWWRSVIGKLKTGGQQEVKDVR